MPGSPLEPILDDSRVRKIDVTGSHSHLAATNTALAEASGDFVGFLFPGDRLSEDALYQIATAITADDDADIFYTDEDSIDSSGLRQEPRFKPGWDRDLLLAGNYVGQFAAFRRTLLQHLGELRESAGDASFWDLLLRAAAVLTDDRIRHLPFVGYHRRKKESGDGSEPAIADTASRILSEHLRSCGEPSAEFMPAAPGTKTIRVVRQLPHPKPFVSIIVPTRDRVDLLQRCVDGVLNRTDYSRLELLIVDNDSRDPDTLAFLAAIPDKDRRVRVLQHPGIFNYSAINNAAAREAQGDVLLLLNNDIEVISPPWLGEMVSHVVRLEVGAVGAKLLYPDGRLQHGGIVLGPDGAVVHLQRLVDRFEPGYLNQLSVARTLSAVTGACMAIRHAVYEEGGGLDETNLPVAYNDIDLCLRLGDLGYKIIWTPFAELIHHESASRPDSCVGPALEQGIREKQRFRATWGRLADTGDPFHNPNLLFAWDLASIPVFPPRGQKTRAELATVRS